MYDSDDNDKMQRRVPPSFSRGEQQPQTSSAYASNVPDFVRQSVGSYVFETGKLKAKQALNIYSHIDYLRPYFDVEPKDVLNRLLQSLMPFDKVNNLPTELYGPVMIIFTLSAILIYQMKMANHSIQDGTLIGTAFFVCFSYWIGFSFLISSISFLCNSTISLFNFLSLIGYSMFSHCIVLLIGTFIHTKYDHVIFYGLWVLLGGAAALRMAVVMSLNTPHPRYRLLIALLVVFMHLGFLLYLHFAYHELAEEVSHALFDKEAQYPLKEKLNENLFTTGMINIQKELFIQNDTNNKILRKIAIRAQAQEIKT